MTVRYYQFGKKVGGIESGGSAAIPAEAPYGPAEQFSNVIPTPPGQVTANFTRVSKYILLRNTSDLNTIQYSFDGVIFQDLGPYGEVAEPVSVSSIVLRETTGTGSTYEIDVTLTE